jgi:hypothetical protein
MECQCGGADFGWRIEEFAVCVGATHKGKDEEQASYAFHEYPPVTRQDFNHA